MAGVSFRNVGKVTTAMRERLDVLKEKVTKNSVEAARTLLEECLKRTPVWEGTTAASYATGLNSIPTRAPVIMESGDPGHTNSMALGTEPNRAEAEAHAWADFESATGSVTTLSKIFITNNSPHWALVDAGEAPGGNLPARNKGGVSLLAVQAAKSRLGGTVK